jgi:hypothetical protein
MVKLEPECQLNGRGLNEKPKRLPAKLIACSCYCVLEISGSDVLMMCFLLNDE